MLCCFTTNSNVLEIRRHYYRLFTETAVRICFINCYFFRRLFATIQLVQRVPVAAMFYLLEATVQWAAVNVYLHGFQMTAMYWV